MRCVLGKNSSRLQNMSWGTEDDDNVAMNTAASATNTRKYSKTFSSPKYIYVCGALFLEHTKGIYIVNVKIYLQVVVKIQHSKINSYPGVGAIKPIYVVIRMWIFCRLLKYV